jgi:hypothetical protein
MAKKEINFDPNVVEWSTSGLLSEPITQPELAKALLSEEEAKAFTFTAQTLIVDHHFKFNSTEQALEALLNHIKPNAILTKAIDSQTKDSFHFVTASNKISKIFGLSSIKVDGTRSKVTGITISSLADIDKPEVHIHKYGNVLRAFKKKYPKITILPDPKKPCIATGNCNKIAHKLLSDIYNEVNNNGKNGKKEED